MSRTSCTGKWRALAALVAAASLLLPACGRRPAESRQGAEGPAAGRESVPVEIAIAQRAEVERKAEFVGSLAGVEALTVSSEAEGTIEATRVDLGDAVARGQVLLTLVSDEFRFRRDQARAEVDQVAATLGIPPDADTVDIHGTSLVRKAEAEYRDAETDRERRRELAGRNLFAREEVEDAEARFLVAEANGSRTGRTGSGGGSSIKGSCRKIVMFPKNGTKS